MSPEHASGPAGSRLRLIVNRTAMKTYPREIGDLVERLRLAVG